MKQTDYEIRTPARTGAATGYGWEIFEAGTRGTALLKSDAIFTSPSGARLAAAAALDLWQAKRDLPRR